VLNFENNKNIDIFALKEITIFKNDIIKAINIKMHFECCFLLGALEVSNIKTVSLYSFKNAKKIYIVNVVFFMKKSF
jgi:hypothetical protein